MPAPADRPESSSPNDSTPYPEQPPPDRAEPEGTRFDSVPAADPERTHFSSDRSHFDADPESTHFSAVEALAPGGVGEGLTRTATPAGRVIGRYQVLRALGRGGMGEVYLAQDLKLPRHVALKMTRQDTPAASVARFQVEARAAAQLNHPGIVSLYEIGEHQGRPYFVMEYVEGGTLKSKVADGPLPNRVAARLVEEVAEAVQHAHERGILHRDLKPSNILLSVVHPVGSGTSSPGAGPAQAATPPPSGSSARAAETAVPWRPKVSDFGLARQMNQDDGLTVTGEVMGTPSYMPPEQALGRVRELSVRTDVYSLGAVLYELVTGRAPFQGPTRTETIMQLLEQEPVPPRRLNPGVPRDLETICLKCLHKEPAGRYASAQELADDLRRFQKGEPIHARPAGAVERAVKWARRRPALAGLMATTAVVTVVAFVFISWAYGMAAHRLGLYEQANRMRVQGQVEQLETTTALTLPAVLDALNQEPEARPLLEALWEQLPAGTRDEKQHRMRVALALLPTDPGAYRAALAQWLLEVEIDPREFLVVRDALRPYAAPVTEQFWEVAEDKDQAPATRFRALAALAGFDPASPRWRPLAEVVVAELLQSSNPLYLGIWALALEPAKGHLLGPLGVAFRDQGQLALRRPATSILAVYLRDRPDLLPDLLADADPKQCTELWPLAQRHRASLLPGLERELQRTPQPAWNDRPPDPSWAPVDEAVTAELTQALGLVEERLAFCQALPLDRAEAVSAALERSGYRLWRFRPYRDGKQALAAALWARDDRQSRAALGRTAEEVRHEAEQFRARGWVAEEVAAYADPAQGGAARYAVVWRPLEAEELRPLLDKAVVESGAALSSDGVPWLALWLRRQWSQGSAGDGTLWPVERGSPVSWEVEKQRAEPGPQVENARRLLAQGYRLASLGVLRAPAGRPRETTLTWHRPPTEAARLALARRQSNAAALLARLEQPGPLWEMLRQTEKPDARSQLLQKLAALGVKAALLVDRLEQESDVSARRALILGLGEYDGKQLPAATRERLVPLLLKWYEHDPDPGVHGAIDWLLRHGHEGPEPRPLDWGQAAALNNIDDRLAGQPPGDRRWLVSKQRQTFTIVPAGAEFTMGSPPWEPGRLASETQHRRQIPRAFAVATKAVTVAQWRTFLRANPQVNFESRLVNLPKYSPNDDGPICGVNWFEAAQYCRWLTEQDGPGEDRQCFPVIPNVERREVRAKSPQLPADGLRRPGYRLPTEAEWEFACRAGTTSIHSFGSDEALLSRYAWYERNARRHAWPVGQKRPNDLGLFDMHGNVWQWCYDPSRNYPTDSRVDELRPGRIPDGVPWCQRGASYFSLPTSLRSAARNPQGPSYSDFVAGFRLAMTLPADTDKK